MDGLNSLFIRSWVCNPAVSASGAPIGGLRGSLTTLQKICRETNPNRIVIVWDGQGGSTKRRLMNKNYKQGRKPIRLNRNIKNLSENQEFENKIWQMTRLFDYLNQLPIMQFLIDSVEADDVISAVAQHAMLKPYNKIIVSSDKDFIQLCDDSTILFRPIQEEVLTKHKIVEEYGIHPNNFCLARSICGDKSDNIKGIDGVGLSTIAKRFPMLSEEKCYTIKELIEESRKNATDGKIKAYESICANEEIIKDNYKIMQLAVPNISVQDSQKIDYTLVNSECTFNKTEFIKYCIQDGLADVDFSDLFLRLKMIQLENC